MYDPRRRELSPVHSTSNARSSPGGLSSATSRTGPGSSSPAARAGKRQQHRDPTGPEIPSFSSTQFSPRVHQSWSSHTPSGYSTPVVQGVPLVSLRQALPDRFKEVFPFELFNPVQSKCFRSIYDGKDNVVVAAPTGSGKTALLELAICKLALDRGNENFKIVYQAPTKALCSERARDWEKKFSHMKLKCAELTGDTSLHEMRRVGDASIIITTPEKWDSITRKWQDHRKLLQLVELFLIDEVHILKDARGATLEAVVSRMKTIGANVRFVALSATVPNSEDIAKWLGRNHTNPQTPAHRETFGEEFRPVTLQKFVYGYECNGNDWVFDKFLDAKLPGLIAKHSKQKPILVFCFTRKLCESTATLLAEYASGKPDDHIWPMPSTRVPVISRELQDVVKFGVAFHHAGLDTQDRNAVEQHFLKGQLGVICCTSTLAVGINLPCHTVVLKGTVGYGDDRLQEYSDLEVMQMLGRAGRPQFDDSATAIILTRKANEERYKKMVSGHEILESTLHLHLIEHLNSEIGLGTINDIQSAKAWLGGTFLSVRLRRNPDHYRLTGGISNPTQIDDRLEEICERDIKLLQEADLVTDHEVFKCTEYGRAMSKYMVEFTTMKLLLRIPRAAGIEVLITILSQAAEFNEFRFKPAERPLFRELNRSPLIVYPVKEVVAQTHHKISLMVQAHLGSVQYSDSDDAAKFRRQLMVEKKIVFERMQRLIRAVIDCKGHDRDAVGTRNALELTRALSADSWEGRPTQLTQIPNIGPAGMRRLANKSIRTVLELADKDPDEIERLMSRQMPFGKKIKDDLEKFPRLSLELVNNGRAKPVANGPVSINVGATLRYLNRKGPPNWLGKSPALTFHAESTDGRLLYFWRGSAKKLDKDSGTQLKFCAPLQSFNESIIGYFSCEEIVGTIVSKVLRHNLPESAFSGLTETRRAIQTGSLAQTFDYLEDDNLEDWDELQAVANQAVSLQPPAKQAVAQQEPDELDNEYPLVEDLLRAEGQADHGAKETQTDADQDHNREPVQLPNGRWQCNHLCSGGASTKSGKPCTHRCCKEGLDKPRKRPIPRPKARKMSGNGDGDVNKVPSTQSYSESTPHSTEDATEPPLKRHKGQPESSITVTQSTGRPAKLSTSSKSTVWKKMDLNNLNVEFIDLSEMDDEVAAEKPAIAKKDHFSTRVWSGSHLSQAPQSSHIDISEKTPKLSKSSALEKPTGIPGRSCNSTQPIDYFIDDDVGFFEDMPSFARLTKLPFKDGARDEILYQESSDVFDDTGLLDFAGSPFSSCADSTTKIASEDNKENKEGKIKTDFKDRETPDFGERTALFDGNLPGANYPGDSLPDDMGDVNVKEGHEPAWVAEFDPDFVDLFRGYVNFV
ncbi:hypothetical protein B0T22DRAFT_420334 [Podospora appendiculata]|uniref:DNA 3'-5' helicase n=1 Tax=Podospora appendiculata TaxID=314037 RepID=A0AAE0XHP5_9PEZI|nr:hypothetical protein B0T22DRAFT_420334 [Podospora appendiculata]